MQFIDDIQFIDSHCHLDFDAFGDDEQRSQLWQQCRQQGIEHMLVPGVEPEQWSSLAAFVEAEAGLLMGVGIHPWFIARHADNPQGLIDSLKDSEYLSSSACVAIGECGLDAMIDVDFTVQQSLFEQHIKLACDLHKPLVIHVRKTHNQTIELLKRYRPAAGGVIHGFSGSLELAQAYWAMGFYLGIGGTITYERANKTRNTVQQMPLEALLLETDAPDMPLHGYQGQNNSPLRVIDVVQSLAALRQQPLEDIARQTTVNARQLFAIS